MHQILFWNTTLYEFLWLFLIYALIGWCVEVAAHAVTLKKFINRGFLNGAYCPIYGFGVILVVICLTPIKDNILLLFLGSVVLTSILEFITGFLLEKVFHTRWWDYSDQKYNVGGYICAKYSLIWGLACVFVMKVIQPLVMDFIHIIPRILGQVIIVIALTSILVDFVTVVISLTGMNKRMKIAANIRARIHGGSNKIGARITDEVLELEEKLDELPDRKGAIEKRLIKAFPALSKLENQTNKDELKKQLKEKIKIIT